MNLKQIEMKNGDVLDFDKLVIATGSSYSLPIKESAAKSVFVASRGVHLVAAHQKLRTSQTIIVIGGGIVGVELGLFYFFFVVLFRKILNFNPKKQ